MLTPRRRHRFSFVLSILILLVIFLSFHHFNSFDSYLFDDNTSSASSNSKISNPEHTSWIWTLPNSLIASFRRKTISYANSNNEIIDTNNDSNDSNNEIDSDDDTSDTKLRLISDSQKKIDPNNGKLTNGYEFFNKVFKILYEGKPKIKSLQNYLTKERIYHARYDTRPGNNEDPVFTEEYLSRFLQLSDSELESMVKSHKYVIDHLPENAPDQLFKGDGIVFVGGGKFNWLTLLSIKSIRAMGSELPIEVLVPKLDEYEPDLCARVFPALNARCIYLPHVLSGLEPHRQSSYVDKFEFKGFQYKALAILVLSFENVLLLDSDNIPVHLPDSLFKQEPFLSNGLIVWPDFWKRATSPDYYQIAGRKISNSELLPIYNEYEGLYKDIPQNSEYFNNNGKIDLSKTPLHQRQGAIPDPTSESGQLMISKKTHTKALILALYYNLYGPTHFYPLFSQGSDGEGDKETFLAATVALGKPFYQVAKFLNAFGYFDSDHNFQGTGMGQYDPVEDFEINEKNKILATKSPEERDKMISKDLLLQKGPRILFVHANYPKLDPWELKKSKKIFNKKGGRIRLYGTGMKLRTGIDFETTQWTNMKFLLCELKIDVKLYQNVDRTELCEEINEHLDFLRSTISTLE